MNESFAIICIVFLMFEAFWAFCFIKLKKHIQFSEYFAKKNPAKINVEKCLQIKEKPPVLVFSASTHFKCGPNICRSWERNWKCLFYHRKTHVCLLWRWKLRSRQVERILLFNKTRGNIFVDITLNGKNNLN